jgi:DNA 3'-phosphatase
MWKFIDSVIYYIAPKFEFNKSLAIFNFIDTLVVLKKNFTTVELKYKYNCIKTKLQEISSSGASIIIFQSFSTDDIDHIKELFDLFIIDTDLPITAFFTTDRNKYMKPLNNIWKLIELFYRKQKKPLEKNHSIVVGNNAGRINKFNNKKLDYDCSDRAFALNINITFFTPDRFFLNEKALNLWQFSDKIINKNDRLVLLNDNNINAPVILDEINLLEKSNAYTIIITGPPSSGKKHLSKQLKNKWECDYKLGSIDSISENDNSSINELLVTMDIKLKQNKSIIFSLNCVYNNITKVIRTSMINHIPILIIELKITPKLNKLLDYIKIQKSNTYKTKLQSIIQWNEYYREYKEPKYNELMCVRHIIYPFIVKPCENFWIMT